jgi:hypothetical protein
MLKGIFVACPVTSRGGWPNARQVSAADMADGSLPLASWVRADKVVTLHTGLVVRQFGRVKADFRAAVAADVCRLIHAPRVS